MLNEINVRGVLGDNEYMVCRDNKGRVIGNGVQITPQDNSKVRFIRHLTTKERRQGINGNCPLGCGATHQYWIGVHWYKEEGTAKYYLMQYCPLHKCGHAVSIAYKTVEEVLDIID